MKPVIETINLTKRYPQAKKYGELISHPFQRREITALREVNIQVMRGELFGLLGPNGAGKTTLLKILSTLVLPTEGRAYVGGYDVETEDEKIRGIIGYVVSEERSFYWRLTGRQNLKFFATLNNLPAPRAAKRIREVLELVELEKEADKKFKDYATGMRQRLAFARAMLNNPAILIMDEPTKSLDPTAAKHLQRFIKDTIVGENGKTVLFATHNLKEAENLSDRIAIIDRAEVKACGTLQQIRRVMTAKERYRLILREPSDDLHDALSSINGILGTTIIRRDRTAGNAIFEIETDGADGSISKAITAIINAGGEVYECTPERASLDDIFAEITKGDD